MFREVREVISNGGAAAVAVGVAIGFAALELVRVVVDGLIAPVISAVVGEARFSNNAFTINGSEFAYGLVIESAIVFLMVIAAAGFALRWLKGSDRVSKE